MRQDGDGEGGEGGEEGEEGEGDTFMTSKPALEVRSAAMEGYCNETHESVSCRAPIAFSAHFETCKPL